ncbi:MAG: DUF2500 domain-containing protein [Bacillota bacterium]|nr:DUF2500 domain-containing protein [Bacillota bacterium]
MKAEEMHGYFYVDFCRYFYLGSRNHRHCRYYLTFAVESGDKMTFEVDKEDFDMIDEQEFGMLTFQGSRYLGFERS